MTDITDESASIGISPEEGGIRELDVYLQREDDSRVVKINPDLTLMALLVQLEMPVDGVIAFSEGVPIPLDDVVWDLRDLTIITVASGG